MISLNFVFIIISKLFTGKKPPEETSVIDKLKELKDLKSDKYNIKKMIEVKKRYTIPIFKHCLIVSLELKFIKFVKDFFKFLSKISINSIIDIKKYSPPSHCVEDLHNIKLSSKCLILLKIVNPVEVNPEILSK
tara:strand:+ start:983 stop:1384 length:402 start_codon:yes stop_codon:yes gene_type:complete